MVKVSVFIRDKSGGKVEDDIIKDLKEMAHEDIKKLAETCADTIKKTINDVAKHPTGNLALGFYAHEIPDGYAVGDVAELDTKYKYWNHVDKGSEAIGANWDHFIPNGKWKGINSRDYGWITPKKPIKPLNYIAKTMQKMELLIPKILKGK